MDVTKYMGTIYTKPYSGSLHYTADWYRFWN